MSSASQIESQRLLPLALSISEILFCIFKDFGPYDCMRAALVCRTWAEVALDIAWRELDTPHHLLLLLGQVTAGGGSCEASNQCNLKQPHGVCHIAVVSRVIPVQKSR